MAIKNEEEKTDKRGGKIKPSDVDYEKDGSSWRAVLREDETQTATGPDRTTAFKLLREKLS